MIVPQIAHSRNSSYSTGEPNAKGFSKEGQITDWLNDAELPYVLEIAEDRCPLQPA